MASNWLIIEGTLAENATSHTATIDKDTIASFLSAGTNARLDLRQFDFHIQITGLGTAASVTVEGLGAGNAWTTVASSKTAASAAAANFHKETGAWQAIRLTWTGGTPNGAGTASFYATRKFNGV